MNSIKLNILNSEKSTTREVNSLLKPYLLPAAATAAAGAPDSNNNDTNKAPGSKTTLLSNLKVSCRGLTLLKLNHGTKEEDQPLAAAKLAQQAVMKIYENAAATTESTPQIEFIQRLIPILSTCLLEVNALQACASRVAGIAALEFQQNRNDIDSGGGEEEKLPTTFGIHINNRESGAIHSSTGESTEGDLPDITTKPADVAPDRMQIISAVAAGLATELKDNFNIDAKVDLKAPTVVVTVEVLPIMGKMYAGIAILPQKVCNLKPKLGIKVLRQPRQQTRRGRGGSGAGKKANQKKNDQQN